MTRIIIFTGKGGVGKTSVAAATAWRSAQMHCRTLLVSTDMAHNLGDLFERRIGRETVQLSEYLDALELDPEYIMQEEFADLGRAIANLLSGMAAEANGDLLMLAGMEELFSLLKLLAIYESNVYERIIVDCAPTGETLALLKFPELLGWYMEKFFPIGKAAVRILSPLSKKVFQVELPDRRAMNDLEKLYVRLIDLQEILKDHTVTSVRLVTLAEKMVVEETKRSYMYLNLYGYQVDGLYINRVLPETVDNDYFDQWQQLQKHYITELEAVFAQLPITKINWYETDICTQEAIARISQEALTAEGLFDIPKTIDHERYEKVEDGYLLTLYLPLVEKGELELYLAGLDLIIRIGNFKRSIPLPNALRGLSVASAKLDDGWLRVKLVREGESYAQGLS